MEKCNELVYAIDINDNLVHVDNVPNEKRCNCFCPSCRQPLIAKQGKIKSHHFSHINDDAKCEYGYQTSIHLLAKKIFEESSEIKLPDFKDYIIGSLRDALKDEIDLYDDKFKGGFASKTDEINDLLAKYRDKIFYGLRNNNFTVKPESVSVEKKLDDFIPDIILYINNHPLVVEIYVTHKVDVEKLNRIKKAGVSAIEFDLSKIDKEIDENLLRNMLSDGHNASWLNNKKISRLVDDEKKSIKSFLDRKILQQQKIFQKHNGIIKRYKIYTLNSDICIFNPPCNSNYIVNYNGSKVKSINSCEKVFFFVRFDKKIDEVSDDFPQEIITHLYCRHK